MSNVRTIDEILDLSLGDRRFHLLLFGVFAALALVLAAVGIYAVAAQAVVERTHEIGIRMALGARPVDVLGLMLREGAVTALAGIAAGLAAAAAATRWMSSMLFGISCTDALTFTATALLLLGVALAASLVAARCATRVDPTVALRSER